MIIGDTRDVLQTLPAESVDLILTSPPFVGLRSYTDDPRELGREPPAEYLDELLKIIGYGRRTLAPHGTLIIEVGDTYSGSGGSGGDQREGGWKEGRQSPYKQNRQGDWPLAKSLACVPEALAVALAYGRNPLTGDTSPAGRWIVRNAGVWNKPNPRPGEETDKFRNAWSLVIMASLAPNRYWYELAARKDRKAPHRANTFTPGERTAYGATPGNWRSPAKEGAAVTDVFTISAGAAGKGSGHQAPWPESLAYRMIDTQCPLAVCTACGRPARYVLAEDAWTDCKHDLWRRGMVLDPFAGSGTTLVVANGAGRDSIGIDLDGENAVRVRNKIGGLFLDVGYQPSITDVVAKGDLL